MSLKTGNEWPQRGKKSKFAPDAYGSISWPVGRKGSETVQSPAPELREPESWGLLAEPAPVGLGREPEQQEWREWGSPAPPELEPGRVREVERQEREPDSQGPVQVPVPEPQAPAWERRKPAARPGRGRASVSQARRAALQ